MLLIKSGTVINLEHVVTIVKSNSTTFEITFNLVAGGPIVWTFEKVETRDQVYTDIYSSVEYKEISQ